MPKLPFKSKPANDGESLNAYIPSQMVDYTSLPPIEEETSFFKRLPAPLRIGVIALPVLLVLGALWSVWTFLNPSEPVQAEQPPVQPTLAIESARVVNQNTIAVEARSQFVADGTPISATLLIDGAPSMWADAASSAGQVANNQISLRLTKAANAPTLNRTAKYEVHLAVGADQALEQTGALDVPVKLADAFFAAPVAEAPTPEPTAAPTATPAPPTATPAPPTATPDAGPPMLTVTLQTSAIISPTLGSSALSSVKPGTSLQPLLRTSDNKWYLVQVGNNVAWLYADQVKLDPAANARIALVTPAAKDIAAGPNKATVFNGGNIRWRPDVKRGTVLGQLHAGQTVTLKGKTTDGQWFKIVAPEAEGWVSVSLLDLDAKAFAAVTVVDPAK